MTRRLKSIKPKLLQRASPSRSTHNWADDDLRGDRHQRGYGYKWEKLRKQILAAACGLCQCDDCKGGEKRLRPANQVHHIVGKTEARRLGWTEEQIDHPSNLMAINDKCHEQITARQGKH